MSTILTQNYFDGLVSELRKLPVETGWVEFKENYSNPEEIGEYLSALSNTAALQGKANGYLVWGIQNTTHAVVGTTFKPAQTKKGNEDIESWLAHLLNPRLHFHFHELQHEGKPVVVLEIPRASGRPVRFRGIEFIRVGSYRKKLKDHPQIEKDLWRVFDTTPFEEMIAMERVDVDNVLTLLDYPSYFDLLNQSLPSDRDGILGRLHDDRMIVPDQAGGWDITNPGLPLVKTERFLDTPPRSRNEVLASFMRRIGVCEERGSGVDKVVFQTEFYQLPAPIFETVEGSTRAILFAHKALKDMDRADRSRACYLHACLRYVQRDPMTNSSLRQRFGIAERNSAMVSRIIREAVEDKLVKPYDPKQGKKYAKYLPFWS